MALANRPRTGSVKLDPDNARAFIYVPKPNFGGTDTFTYRISDGQLSSNGTVTVAIQPVNDEPTFPEPTFPMDRLERAVSSSAVAGTNVGAPVAAADVDGDPLVYELTDANRVFEIDQYTGQITVAGNVTLDTAKRYMVTVTASDEKGGLASVDVTITVSEGPVTITPVFGGGGGGAGGGDGGGGGGGGASGPSPSTLDFEWTVKHDLKALDESNGIPTGLWGRDGTLWVAQNGDGANDGVYAYDLETGERAEEREFALDERNRAPRGIWSEGETAWVSDSGQDKLFAYDLASGERLPNRDIAFDARNRGRPRHLVGWQDVLGARRGQGLAFRLRPGERRAARRVRPRLCQRRPARGLWSDGVAIWVSGPWRQAPLRLPAPDAACSGGGGARPRAGAGRGVRRAERGQ